VQKLIFLSCIFSKKKKKYSYCFYHISLEFTKNDTYEKSFFMATMVAAPDARDNSSLLTRQRFTSTTPRLLLESLMHPLALRISV
jgi:hypothetical protein